MGKFAAKGVVLAISDGVIPTFNPVAQIFSLSGPTLSADVVDVSSHDNAKFYRDFVNSFRDGGEITMGLRWDPDLASHGETGEGLLNVYERDVSTDIEITWPNAAADVWTLSVFVTGYEPSADFDAALEATVTMKVTGIPIFA